MFLVYHIGYYKNGRFDSAVAISCALFALSLIVTVVKHISDAFYLSVYLGYEYGEVWHVLMPKLVAPLALCVLLTFFVVNYFKGRLSSFVLLLSAIFVLVSAVQGLTNQFADLAFSSNVDYNVAQAFILIGSVAQVIFFVAILIFVMNNYDDIAEENKGPVKKKLLTLVIVVLSVVVFVLIASPASVAIAQNIFSKW